jgi:hypothetical protein
LQPQHVNPELLQPQLVRAANGDLLQAENFEGTGHEKLLKGKMLH